MMLKPVTIAVTAQLLLMSLSSEMEACETGTQTYEKRALVNWF